MSAYTKILKILILGLGLSAAVFFAVTVKNRSEIKKVAEDEELDFCKRLEKHIPKACENPNRNSLDCGMSKGLFRQKCQ